ncbi:MAG: hypothetical protein NHF90_00470 [Candidatus Shikimatogenerans sp. JK-2022]|nr:hypothetical protein [Candidatus Shikimatogenerans bostrichidophilus]
MFRIIFMSNGEFGIPTFKYLIKKKQHINYLITSKKKIINNKLNIIRKIAKKNNIKIINSEELEKKKNIKKIIISKPNLQILISFKIIKKEIWKIPNLGTINIHPSLLPKYKGVCPINWAIINGDKYTGLTSFFINDDIDNGPIILQKKIKIPKNINFKYLYKKLSFLTKFFLIKTINKIKKYNYYKIPILQKPKKIKGKLAPKINNYYSKLFINHYDEKYINQLVLGLPDNKPAWCFINIYNNIYILNIFEINLKIKINLEKKINLKIGKLLKINKKIFIKTKNYFIELLKCQLNNKKKMNILDIYNGLKFKKEIFIF